MQTILRREWGFKGNILTDWWMRNAPSPEFPHVEANGYRVRSGVDVLMPGSQRFASAKRTPDGTLLKSYGKPEGITLGEMLYCAKHVHKSVMRLKQLR